MVDRFDQDVDWNTTEYQITVVNRRNVVHVTERDVYIRSFERDEGGEDRQEWNER